MLALWKSWHLLHMFLFLCLWFREHTFFSELTAYVSTVKCTIKVSLPSLIHNVGSTQITAVRAFQVYFGKTCSCCLVHMVLHATRIIGMPSTNSLRCFILTNSSGIVSSPDWQFLPMCHLTTWRRGSSAHADSQQGGFSLLLAPHAKMWIYVGILVVGRKTVLCAGSERKTRVVFLISLPGE